jgi:hypothetical protein
LPNADQRVRPGPQHHLLQRPDRGPVLLPRRLEDPPPQSGCVLLMETPDNGVPIEDVLGSVHLGGVQLAPRFAGQSGFGVQRLTCPRRHPSGPGRKDRHPAGSPQRPPGATAICHESRCLSATGICFLGILSRRGIPPLSRSAYRTTRARTPTGFPRSTHARHDRGGRSLNPEASGVHATGSGRLRSPLAATTSGSALSPGTRSVVPGLR